MIRTPYIPVIAGMLAAVLLALIAAGINGPAMADELSARAQQEIAKAGGKSVVAEFENGGWPSRHPLLVGGDQLDRATRTKVARAVWRIPGVGGVSWADQVADTDGARSEVTRPLHCEEDVTALLRARTIRFEEASTRIDADSRELIDEVAAALRPCVGGIIAVTGHTDASGPEAGNIALSQERAASVREALIRRGIPADGLRSRGAGSAEPVDGLDPTDPANRRIEFSVIAKVPIRPTAVDTPGAD
jgi:OOP family OmpA-OmpF porin